MLLFFVSAQPFAGLQEVGAKIHGKGEGSGWLAVAYREHVVGGLSGWVSIGELDVGGSVGQNSGWNRGCSWHGG